MYGISHQKAGLNRPGRYKEGSRERRLLDALRNSKLEIRNSKEKEKEQKETLHAKWTRITGITGAVEGKMTAKERRDGLKRLVERIKEFATEGTEHRHRGHRANKLFGSVNSVSELCVLCGPTAELVAA